MMIVLIFTLGAIIGSFLNVCIDRLPRRESLWRPVSHCRACQRPLRWFELMPLFSYMACRGRCCVCHTHIPRHHLIVEFFAAALFSVLFDHYGWSEKFILSAALSSVLLVIAWIDFYWLVIPNALLLAGFFVALLEILLLPAANDFPAPLIGCAAGALMLGLPGYAGKFFSGRDCIGAGDIKLAAMLGVALGGIGVIIVLWCACLLGALYGLAGVWRGGLQRTSKIPLGFFIGLSALGYNMAAPWCFHLITAMLEAW